MWLAQAGAGPVQAAKARESQPLSAPPPWPAPPPPPTAGADSARGNPMFRVDRTAVATPTADPLTLVAGVGVSL